MSKRLTTAEWAEIILLYERGEKTPRQLGEQFGISRQAVQKGLNDRGVVRDSRLDETRSDISDAASEARRERVKHASSLQANYAKYMDALSRMAISKIVEASKGDGIASVNADMLTLKNGIAVIAKARQESWEVLDVPGLLTDEDELPELNIGTYSPEELGQIQMDQERDFVKGLEDEENGLLDDDDEDIDGAG